MRVKVGGTDYRFACFFSAHGPRRKMRAPCSGQIEPFRQHGQARPGPGYLPPLQRGRRCPARPDARDRSHWLRQNDHALFGAQRAEQSRVTTSSRSKTRSNSRSRASTRCRCKKEIGLTFANALRSILRQDPDIVMIGEIRDTETAEIAVEAALTGHQVLSTMHCNDAAGAIARLDDMGIAPFLISSSVILACAQRLMRRICPLARSRSPIPPQDVSRISTSIRVFSMAHPLPRPRL